MGEPGDNNLNETPLAGHHEALGARMVPFAGYLMPVQYEGIIAEHQWTRAHAGLFDVGHMGIVDLVARDGKVETAARALETLVPADILALKPGRQRYTQFLNDKGGILDDLMVARPASHEDRLTLVVNAGCKESDIALLKEKLSEAVEVTPRTDLSLIALQGPEAAAVLSAHDESVADMAFMSMAMATIAGVPLSLTRSGYTGEDGYELAVPENSLARVWSALLEDPRVKPVGLGARDSLRLEAGLCLYGHDMDSEITPVEAGLSWSIQKRRRVEGGFPGAARIQNELANGTERVRVGVMLAERGVAREGALVVRDTAAIGTLTSGGFAPSLGRSIAMGYVDAAHASAQTKVDVMVRNKPLDAQIVEMPFVPHRFKR